MDKIIIMGLAESGKTTIVKVAAEGFIPNKNAPYSATLDYKRKTYTMFGKKISLFDLGGQKSFLERFVGNLAEFIFANVSSLIYVVDVVKISELSLCQYYLNLALENLRKFSPEANISILFHKMDLIDKKQKGDYINNIKEFFELTDVEDISFYETSVFDDSAIKTMEDIITNLKDESNSFEGKIKSFQRRYQNYLQEMFLLDDKGKVLFKTSDKNPGLTKEYDLLMAYKSGSQEIINYIITGFKAKFIFASLLPNYYYLHISYKLNEQEIPGEIYSTLLSGSIKISNELGEIR